MRGGSLARRLVDAFGRGRSRRSAPWPPPPPSPRATLGANRATWLSELQRNSERATKYLRAESAHAHAFFESAPTVKRVADEAARTLQPLLASDSIYMCSQRQAAEVIGKYRYWTQHSRDDRFPVISRESVEAPRDSCAQRHVVFDANALHDASNIVQLCSTTLSACGRWLAYTVDTGVDGEECVELRVRDTRVASGSGVDDARVARGGVHTAAWLHARDSCEALGVVFVSSAHNAHTDEHANESTASSQRPHRVLFSPLLSDGGHGGGHGGGEWRELYRCDASLGVAYEDASVSVGTTKDARLAMVHVDGALWSEIHVLAAHRSSSAAGALEIEMRTLQPRRPLFESVHCVSASTVNAASAAADESECSSRHGREERRQARGACASHALHTVTADCADDDAEETRCFMDHVGGNFYQCTNANGAFNYALRVANSAPYFGGSGARALCAASCSRDRSPLWPLPAAAAALDWRTLVPERADVAIEDVDIFDSFCVLYERDLRSACQQIRVVPEQRYDASYVVQLPLAPHSAAAFSITPTVNAGTSGHTFRFTLNEALGDEADYEFDVRTRNLAPLLVRRPRADTDGDFARTAYAATAVRVRSDGDGGNDGADVPCVVLHAAAAVASDEAPLLVACYGAYGVSQSAERRALYCALLQRGWSVALCGVRGGGERGARWHRRGKRMHKRNGVADLLACARALPARGFGGARGRVAAHASSAGGLLVCAALMQEARRDASGDASSATPVALRGAVLDQPFVAVGDAMRDRSLPLTRQERAEWGSPLHAHATSAYIDSYDPLHAALRDNVQLQRGVSLLVRGACGDFRAPPWGMAAFVAALRDNSTRQKQQQQQQQKQKQQKQENSNCVNDESAMDDNQNDDNELQTLLLDVQGNGRTHEGAAALGFDAYVAEDARTVAFLEYIMSEEVTSAMEHEHCA